MVLVLGPAGVAVCIYLYPDDYPVWFRGYSVSEGDLASMTPLWPHTHAALWGSVLTSYKQM